MAARFIPITDDTEDDGDARSGLLHEVQAFIARHNLSETQFGCMALNQPKFVFDLKKGKHRPRPRTVAKIRAFMACGDPRPSGRRSMFARRYAETVRRNADTEARMKVFRQNDPVERAKTFMRREGFNVFDAVVHAGNNRNLRKALAGKVYVGFALYDRDAFLDMARRRGWDG